MRSFVFGLCVFAAACSDQGPSSPTSPSGGGASLTAGVAQARVGADLPFRGSFTREGVGEFNCPPTCPPTVLTITSENVGEATHLGRFTATSVDEVNLITDAGTGTWTFTAANGDQLYTTTVGLEHHDVAPGEVCHAPIIGPLVGNHAELEATITGGTGRFAGATGTFIVSIDETVDLGANRGCGSGSFEGAIDLNR